MCRQNGRARGGNHVRPLARSGLSWVILVSRRPASRYLLSRLPALVGPVATATLRSLHLDAVYMGVHGISERAGFSTPNLMEAETNRAFVAATDRLIVLADHTKWNVTGLSSIASLAQAETLITDTGIPPAARSTLGEHIGHVLAADPMFHDNDATMTELRRRA